MSAEELRKHAEGLAAAEKPVKGVIWSAKDGKWRVNLYFDGRQTYLGSWPERAVAIEHRLRAEADISSGLSPAQVLAAARPMETNEGAAAAPPLTARSAKRQRQQPPANEQLSAPRKTTPSAMPAKQQP